MSGFSRSTAGLLAVCVVLGFGLAGGEGDLADARDQFERHNYRAALAAVDRHLAQPTMAQDLADANALRGQCLLKLRRFEEGISVLQEVLAEATDLSKQPELHSALADAGLHNYQYRYLAINHYAKASRLFEQAGDVEAAAETALKCGQSFVHFEDWEKLDDLEADVPDDWRARRVLQRKFAVRWLDRAIELAGRRATATEAMYRKATLYQRELRLDATDLDKALDLFGDLVERWPGSARARQADLEIAGIFEQHKQDYVAAVRQYQRVVEAYPNSSVAKRAGRSLERIVAPRVRIWTGGPVVPGDAAEFQIEVRNIKELTFRAYRVDLFALAREIGNIRGLAKWAPDRPSDMSWTVEIPDTGEHRVYNSQSDSIAPTRLPNAKRGVYVVEAIAQAGSPKSVRAVAVMIVSQLAAVSKGGKNGALLWVVDAVTGHPVDGAEVLVQEHLGKNNYDYREGRSDDAGLFRDGGDRRGPKRGRSVAMYIRHGEDVAVCNAMSGWSWWGYQAGYRLYSFTDRPVYRPDQVIHFKHVLRTYDMGEYANAAKKPLMLKVYDPKGEVVDERALRTNEHGSVSGDVILGAGAALGMYRMQVEVDGRYVHAGRGGRFRVEEYRKPEFEVTVGAAEDRYRIDEPVDLRIEARYYFGTPVADAAVKYTVYRSAAQPTWQRPMPYPWYFTQLAGFRGEADAILPGPYWYPRVDEKSLVERGELRTDSEGVALLRISSDHEARSAAEATGFRYIVEAEVTDSSRRTVTGSGSVNVTRFPFSLVLQPQRYLYQPGDAVHIDVSAKSPNGASVALEGTMRVHRLKRTQTDDKRGGIEEKFELGEVVAESPISTLDEEVAVFRWTADEEGPFRFVVTAKDDEGDVTGSCDVWIARRGGRYRHYAYRDVELVPDRSLYEVGQTARVLINTRFDDAYVLLTVEADQLVDQRIVHVADGGTVVEIPIETKHSPNIFLVATLLHDNKVFMDKRAIVVPPTQQFLTVEIDSPSETFGPREHAEFEVITTEANGEPVAAEVAVMMVDASLYYIQPELRENVQEFFYGRVRPHAVNTQTSFDWNWSNPYSRGPFDWRLRGRAGGDSVLMAAEASEMSMMARAAPAQATNGTPQFAAVEIRSDFPDSVLWTAHLNTGENGRASIDVEFPDTLTTWRLIAVAVDDDTRVGEAAREFITRKEVIARLETPRFLVERDTCAITVIGHNELPTPQEMKISLTVSGPITVGRATVDGKPLEFVAPNAVVVHVEAGELATVDFEVSADGPGTARFTATASTRLVGDGVEKQIPILPFGSQKLVTRSGVIRQTNESVVRTVAFTLPEEMNPVTPVLEVLISPTIANVCLDAIPYLIQYPYGCTEQTMSRFLPAVVTQRTLTRMGVKLSELSARMEDSPQRPGNAPRWSRRKHPVFNDGVLSDIVAVGIGRLAELQNADGGWGWWKEGASDPYMSAYVIYGLSEAINAGVELRSDMLPRGAAFLTDRVVGAAPVSRYGRRDDDPNVRAWMLYALAVHSEAHLAKSEIAEVIDRVYRDRDELTDYTRAMLAMVLHKAGRGEQAGVVIDNLENTVRVDEDTDTVSWGSATGYFRWYHNGMEATAMVLRAMMAITPDHPHIPRAVNWLVRNRQGARWHSTKDTAFAVYALAEYLETSGELEADMTVTVTFDKSVSRSFRITPDNLLTFDARMIFAPEHLTPGKHTVEIAKQGKGHVYYSVYADYYTKEDPITATGHDIRIGRTYYRLIPKEVEKTRTIWDGGKRRYVEETYRAIDYERDELAIGSTIRSGQLIEVELEIDARNDFEYLIFEDPKPAGCEPVELHSGVQYGGGIYANVELRDQHVAFFANYLRQGKHKLTYRLRCETPGVFAALPTRAAAMYSPYLRANGDSARLTIGD